MHSQHPKTNPKIHTHLTTQTMAAGATHFRPSLLLLLIRLSFIASIPDSDALLHLKKSLLAPPNPLLDSWQPNSNPCDGTRWPGLICYQNIITGIHLGSMGLSGAIDVDSLAQLPGLRTLSFINNSFTGKIPDLNRLTALKAIYISHNDFSGEIPPEFFAKMGSLKKLWLSNNNLTGRIPPSLSQLPHLKELHLKNNRFEGEIPELEQKSLSSLDLSNNRLEGKIPSALSRFNSSSFEGNSALCGEKVGRACDREQKQGSVAALPTSTNPTYKHYSNTKVGLFLMIISGLILFLMVAAIIVMRRREEKFDVLEKGNFEESVEVHVSGSSRKETDFSIKSSTNSGSTNNTSTSGFSFRAASKGSSRGGSAVTGTELVMVNEEKGVFRLPDLMKAAAEVLGNGCLGSSYKASMLNGTTVVVKRLKETNPMERDRFDAQIKRFGRLRHPNILTPLAYHHRKDEKLLIHHYIPKGSLLFLLHGDRGPSHAELDWAARLKIVNGIAQGLGNLHKELSPSELPHGNLKSSNVLLGNNYDPLLVDYGFTTLLTPAQAAQSLFAYKSPEAMQTKHVSPKSDIYCLGILILEILSGKFPSQYLSNRQGGTDVVQWAASAISEHKEAEFFDPQILADSKHYISEMERLLHVANTCTASEPDRRPDMREAARKIEEIRVDDGTQAKEVTGYELPKSNLRTSSWQERNNELSGRRPRGLNSFTDHSG